MPGIDLTPQSEIAHRKTKLVVGFSIKIAIFMLLVTAGVMGFFFYRNYSLGSRVKSTEMQTAQVQSEIQSYSSIADTASKLYAKYNVINDYLNSRLKFSSVVAEISARTPNNITVSSLVFSEESPVVSLSGTSPNNILISKYISALGSEEYYSSSSAQLKRNRPIFKNVELVSLSEEAEDGTSSFNINIEYNPEVIKND